MPRVAVVVLLALAAGANAACPTNPADCLAGGGPAATDCYAAFAGIPSLDATCKDGDPSCDVDGHVDGTCTFGLAVCLDVPAAGCTPATPSAPRVTPRKGAAVALGGALDALVQAGSGCTVPGFPVPLKSTLAGIKAAVARVKVSVAGGGKRDTDKAKLTCEPGAPSFANDVQPILTEKCAFAGCHSAASHQQGLVLDPGTAYGALVGRQMTEAGPLVLVSPGNPKASYVAHKILGKRIAPGTAIMPQGCPGAPQKPNGCLTPAEVATIVSWIQSGAPQN